jgi:two-component system, OmpR family, alkaline phosphatase synthesis response regulator PhoP
MAKILVVDDQPHIVRLLQMELERDAHEVLIAGDGEAALEIARRERPALVVLDVNMPRKDGLEVLRELKSDPDTSAITVILLTVRDQDEDITRGLQVGADWYVPKPFVPGDIAALARRFVGEPTS